MFADDVWRYSPIGPFATLVVGSVGLALMLYVTWVRSARTQAMAWVLLAACGVVILAVTDRGSLDSEGGGFSWHLGKSIVGGLGNPNRELGLLNVVGNVLMFLPVGWLAALVARRRRLVVGALSAAGFSAAIEVRQALSGSLGDVDDVVLNSVGGLLGAGLAVSIQGALALRGDGRGTRSGGADGRFDHRERRRGGCYLP